MDQRWRLKVARYECRRTVLDSWPLAAAGFQPKRQTAEKTRHSRIERRFELRDDLCRSSRRFLMTSTVTWYAWKRLGGRS